ncbi:deoxyribonuclease-1-like [Ptychodera flava]|uniref:deoxyribonuclease-1-like n=1 Tax=Ptychodera flava TaxID=63121 RepID=UPI00396AAB3D
MSKTTSLTMLCKKLLVVTLCIICLTADSRALKIGAFNIQILGITKMSKPDVVQVLADICVMYDVILIQEIRDSSGKAIQQLMDEVNRISNKGFAMVISERLGRSSSKEQYAFLYRRSSVDVVGSFVYDDGYPDDGTDTFEREPFVVRFYSPTTVIKDFAVVAIHTKPGTSVTDLEIDALTDVYDDIVDRWNLKDVLIAGDFNADCSYVVTRNWPDIRLRTQSRFTWLIDDDIDTTVTSSDCAYDRLVVAGTALTNAVQPRSARVFPFDCFFGLDNKQALDVSDHYPVEMVLN